jgi:hypothetical protein
MSTTKYRKRVSQRTLTEYKRHELLTGEIFYPALGYDGYGDPRTMDKNLANFISAEMKMDWEQNKEELMAFWKSGEYTTGEIFPDSKPWLFICGDPDTLPWAAEQFDFDYDD